MENLTLATALFVFYWGLLCILFYDQEIESIKGQPSPTSLSPTLSDYGKAFSVEPDEEEEQIQLNNIIQAIRSFNKKELRKLCSPLGIKQTRIQQGKRVPLTADMIRAEILQHCRCAPQQVIEAITDCLPEKITTLSTVKFDPT